MESDSNSKNISQLNVNLFNPFNPVDQYKYPYKQCRSRWDGLQWAISLGSTLFATLVMIID